MSVNRRDFLRSVASISGATLASTVSFGQAEQIQQLDATLPSPDLSGGYKYLKLERMAYYVHKDSYRRAVREASAALA